MTIIQSSVVAQFFIRFWQAFLAALQESRLKRLIDRIDEVLSAWANGSAVCGLLRQDGIFLHSYPDSAVCKAVSWLANIIPALLHRLYLRLRSVAESSFVCRLIFVGFGRSTTVFLCWTLLLMLVCPYELWNNAYGLLLAFGALALFYLGAVRRSERKLQMTAMGPWWLSYAGMLCVSFLISFDHTTSLRYLCFHLTGLLIALVLVSAVETVSDLLRVTAFGAAGMAAASLYSFYQWINGVAVNASNVDLSVNAGMPGRVYSFFENPNTFGQVLSMLIPLTVGLMLASRTKRGKLAAAAAALMGVVAIAMTYSRGSWIGLVGAVFIFVALYQRKLLPLLILACVAAIPVLPDSILNRILTIFNFSDSSTSSRFPIYAAGLQTVANNPVLGVGLGSDVVQSAVKQGGYYSGTFVFAHLHNIFLQIWAECGTFGLLAFTGTALSTFKESARAAANSRCAKEIRPILIGGAAGLVGVLVCGLTDYVWHYPRVLCIFWFLMGILLAGIKLTRTAKENNPF